MTKVAKMYIFLLKLFLFAAMNCYSMEQSVEDKKNGKVNMRDLIKVPNEIHIDLIKNLVPRMSELTNFEQQCLIFAVDSNPDGIGARIIAGGIYFYFSKVETDVQRQRRRKYIVKCFRKKIEEIKEKITIEREDES